MQLIDDEQILYGILDKFSWPIKCIKLHLVGSYF